MRKIIIVFFSLLWLCLFAAMGIYYIAFSEKGSIYSQYEKRMLKEAPLLSSQTLFSGNLSTDIEAYLTDRFILRKEIIDLSNKVRDLGSIARYQDYIAIQKEHTDALDNTATLDEDLNELTESLLSPSPTEFPELIVQKPEQTVTAQPQVSATPEPAVKVIEPIPVVSSKPIANTEDFPEVMGVYMSLDGNTTNLLSFDRSSVLAITSVLNNYAKLLPDNGRLIFTMVPQSLRGNKYFNSSRNGEFYSDFEECINAFGSNNVFAISASDILGKAMKRGEYVYFRTDMHWTPQGTYLVYRDMIMQAGLEPAEYKDFNVTVEEPFLGTYYRDNPTSYMRENYDTLELLHPPFDLEWRRTTGKDTFELIDFLNLDAALNDRYTVYLGGPAGPWTYAKCDNGKAENCLVITDSFGLAFVPMVTMNYGEVHYYDPRYFDAAMVGYSVSEMIVNHNITDIYVVIGDIHSFDSGFLITYANSQLD